MKVSDLYGEKGPCYQKDVYIIGMGPSLQVFPIDYLKDKFCILLNDASEYLPSLGPIAFSNHKQFLKYSKCFIQIVKARLKSDRNPHKDDNHVSWNHSKYYCFSYREKPWDNVSHFDIDQLFKEPCHYWNIPGGSVSIFATQFAINAGCKSITLVGCDCCDLGKHEYLTDNAQQKRIRKSKQDFCKKTGILNHNYEAYAKGIITIKKVTNIPIVSLTPFVGLGFHKKQFKEMKEWNKKL